MSRAIKKYQISVFVLFSLFFANGAFGQVTEVTGKVFDASDGSPLLGASVTLKGTANGMTTDIEGKYRLVNIPAGDVTLVFRYIGYKGDTVHLNIKSGTLTRRDISMRPDAVQGEEVVVTGQLRGQQAAINQQVNSGSIINVVSKDKIEELPDQNAAESISRLPGISLQRNAGEGQKVVIRGLSPKYNNITINGVKIPSTDEEDRSVDLSAISPDMLSGIEVYKSLTPDQDGDAIGGTVNFTVKKAPEDFHLDLKLQGGYGSQENYYSPYLGSASFSDRYLDNKLGVVLTADIQRANRSSDAQDVTYLLGGEKADGSAIIDVEDLNLADVKEIRKRYGSSLSLDYDLGNGNIMLNTFWSKTDRDQVRRRKRFQLTNARTQYELMTSTIHLQLFSINLQGNHNIGVFQIDWGGSYSESDQNTPEEFNNLFQELSSLKSSLIKDQGPELIPLGVKDDLSNTTFKQSILTSRKVLEHNYTVQLNSKINFDWGKEIAGDVKFGGKMRWKMRTRDDTQYWTAAFSIDSIGVIAKTNPNALYRNFALTPGGNILMNNFLSASDEVGTFLNGKYTFGPSLNVGTMNDFLNNMRYAKMRSGASLYILNPQIDLEDYNATENVSAGYVMMEATMFRDLLIIPGIRIEHTYNNFKSITGTPVTGEDATPNLANAKDTTGVRTYDDFLPMIQMKYKIADWIDVRAAVTKTISRPNYYDLVPWEASSILDHTLDKGNPDLNRTQIWNYDFYVSTYNQYGLFTVGSFYKKLWDVSYTRQSRIQDGGKYNGYTLTQPVNAKSPSTVYGAEFDFQANLTLLPSPFDGIVFSANLALMKSTTYFPLFEVGHMTVYPYSAIVIDTVREGPLPNQANYTGNVSIGYERGGFSGRLSLSTQGKSLSLVGERAELDGYTSEYVRWDLSLQQKIGYGLSVYTNVNNLTNVADKSYLGIERFSTSEEYYGWTLDVGIKYKF